MLLIARDELIKTCCGILVGNLYASLVYYFLITNWIATNSNSCFKECDVYGKPINLMTILGSKEKAWKESRVKWCEPLGRS